MSDEPLPGVTHGRNGYKKGCRCFECRRGHADELRGYRKRKDAAGSHPAGQRRLMIPEGAGTMECRVRTQYHALNLSGPEADTLMDLGYMQAKLIDTIQDSGKWHLLPTAQKSLLDINDRLVKLANPVAKPGPIPESEVDDFVAGLRKQPRPS